MGRLSRSAVASYEDHLTVCGHCMDAVEEAETFISTFRKVASRDSVPVCV